MKKGRKKGPPSRLLMPSTVNRHRRGGSDPSSLSDSVLSSELDGKFPRPLGTPQTLETLQLPEILELIEVPETPETPEFEMPETPGMSDVPEVLEMPDMPGMAELPELPDTPNTPEMPNTPPFLPPPLPPPIPLPPPTPPPLPLHRLPGTPPPPPPPLAPMLSAVLVLSRGLGERLGEDCGKSEIRKSVEVLEEVKSNLAADDEGSVVAPKEEVVDQKEERVTQTEEEVAQKEEMVPLKEEVISQTEEVVDQKEEEVVAQKKEVAAKQEEVDVEQEKEVVVEQEKEVAVEQEKEVVVKQEKEVAVEQEKGVVVKQEKEVVVKQGKEVTFEQGKEVVVKQEKEMTVERETVKWERPKVRAKKERQKKAVPAKLRYFEGIPLQEGENKKELTGWSRCEEREKTVPVVVPEGVQEKCLQCRVRKLRCTLTKKLVAPRGDGIWREGPCWRCVQHGDGHECLIKPGPAGWEFAEKDFTVLPYDPTADFYVRVTKEREIELVNFREEGRQREILEKWTERDEKVVVDTIASCTGKVKISAFAPPRPRNRKELKPFSHGEGATVILRRSV